MPFRIPLTLMPIALGAAPALAQDIRPVLDLPTMAQGQVIGATAKAQATRDARRRQPTPDQITACAQRPRFRRQYGPDHPRLRQLDHLCRGVGL